MILNAILTAIPLIVIRYGLLWALDRDAFRRAAHFAPLQGKEKAAYWAYQLSTVAFFICQCFLRITTDPGWLAAGLAVYGLGILLCAGSVLSFVKPKANGINVTGLYKVSRNPMYVAYFLYFLGCVLLTHSLPLFAILLVFQISSHWIILSEERWCKEKFGGEYIEYMRRVRRYIQGGDGKTIGQYGRRGAVNAFETQCRVTIEKPA